MSCSRMACKHAGKDQRATNLHASRKIFAQVHYIGLDGVEVRINWSARANG